VKRLIYYEEWNNIRDAIGLEKQVKGWLRAKKITLIESRSPKWEDLSAGWYGDPFAALRMTRLLRIPGILLR
jgi:putative endonuclease